jgi:hypothetical protein
LEKLLSRVSGGTKFKLSPQFFGPILCEIAINTISPIPFFDVPVKIENAMTKQDYHFNDFLVIMMLLVRTYHFPVLLSSMSKFNTLLTEKICSLHGLFHGVKIVLRWVNQSKPWYFIITIALYIQILLTLLARIEDPSLSHG